MSKGMTWEREAHILEGAIAKYGEETQVVVAIEECGELIQALTKWLRMRRVGLACTGLLLDNVVEEMADVSIMINQLALIFGDANYKELYKLEKLEEIVFDA